MQHNENTLTHIDYAENAVNQYFYECQHCSQLHETAQAASQCCIALATVNCPCCWRQFNSSMLDFHAVTIAGHCNYCNPHFSHDQLNKIYQYLAA